MTTARRFSTALRDYAREKIERLGSAEIVVGIPAYLCDDSIVNVIKTVRRGLDTHFHGARALIMVSDGGSTDDTRDAAMAYDVKSFNIEKIITIYRGLPGKGSAIRAIFEAAAFLKPKAIALFDSDLASITPRWVKNILDPVINGYDFVAPDYIRYKFDATITNSIAYNLTRALFGCRIRQPIGGDFGVSLRLARHCLDEDDVWETDIARFGIDIWLTTTAIVAGFAICQAPLGVKVHGEKDPAADLGPMYRQVVGTMFRIMETTEHFWKNVQGSRDIPTIGEYPREEPAPFDINLDELVEYFQTGYFNFNGVWRQILEEKDMAAYEGLVKSSPTDFFLPIETWVRTVYCYASAFHATPRQRMKVLNTMIPLYYARVASLVNELKDKDGRVAEALFQEQAGVFEDMKPYLLGIWQ